MAGLLGAEHVARAADLEVAHGDLEARTERRIFADGRQALLRDLAQRLAVAVAQVGVGVARGAADAAADLMQLRQTHAVRVLDDERVGVRDVDAGLDDGRADQNVDLAVRHFIHDLCDLLLPHFSVNNADPAPDDGSAAAPRWRTYRGCRTAPC